MAAGDIARTRLERDQAQRDLDALIKLNSTGAASASEVSAARQRLADGGSQPARIRAKRKQPLLARRSGARPGGAGRCGGKPGRGAARRGRRPRFMLPWREPSTAWMPRARSTPSRANCCCKWPTLLMRRVRAYFDEPDIGRLAGGPEDRDQVGCQGRTGSGMDTSSAPPVTVITYGTRNVGEVLVGIDDPDDGLLPGYKCQCNGNHLQRAECPRAFRARPSTRHGMASHTSSRSWITNWCAHQ